MTATGRAAAIPPPHVGREEVKTVTGMESIRCTGCGRLLLLAGNRAEIRTTLETKCPRCKRVNLIHPERHRRYDRERASQGKDARHDPHDS